MQRTITRLSFFIILLAVVACSEEFPHVDWKLTIDGDVNRAVTYTYQELVKLRRARLADVPTRNPASEGEKTAWEGVTLFLLLKEPGGVEYNVQWWALVTLADGTSRRFNLSELRGALIALKDGNGNWLSETSPTPLRLIAPNRPSHDWLDGPVRITIQGP